MNVYPYGSRVYGTANSRSDYDFIIVGPKGLQEEINRFGDVDFNFYTKEEWWEKLKRHDIDALECHFHPEPIKLSFYPIFKIDLPTLRKSISTKANHSWVKSKKKLEVEGDIYVGTKSLFHSLRILLFGIQIARYGKIVDFTEANSFWYSIDNDPKDWRYLKDKYQPIFNELATEFKKLAPKQVLASGDKTYDETCGFCDKPCGNDWCVTKRDKK